MDRQTVWRGALLGVLLLAFALRITGIEAQSLWRDEVDALRFAQAPVDELLGNFSRPRWNGPLFYVLLRFWVIAAGQSAFSLRFFSLALSVLGVALVYRIGREWLSSPVALLAGLLMAVAPYMVWYGQEAKMYALVCVLAPATLYAFRRALEGAGWRAWSLTLLLTWVTLGTHIAGALIVPLMVALFFVWWPVARAQWRQASLALASIAVPGAIALPWALPLLIRGADLGHRFISLPNMAIVLLHAFSRGILAEGRIWPMTLGLFLLLAGTVLGTLGLPGPGSGGRAPAHVQGAERAKSDVLALWTWIAVPVLGLYLVSLRVPMFVDRYLIWVGPAFYLLVARGLDQIRRRIPLAFALGLAAAVWMSGQGIWQQAAQPIKSDFRSAAAYVREHRAPGDLVVFHISYVRYTFEYYYGDAAPWADGVATNGETTEEAVATAMRQRTAGYDTVWLVLSEPEMWDRRGMTVGWLDAHGTADLREEWARVSVTRYRLSPAAAASRAEPARTSLGF